MATAIFLALGREGNNLARQYGGFPLRVVGTDLSRKNVSLPSADLIPPGQNNSQQYFQGAAQRLQGAADSLSGGSQLSAQISQQVTENAIKTNEAQVAVARTQAELAGRQEAQTAQTLGGISKMLFDYHDSEEKRKAAQQESRYKQARDAVADQRESIRLAIAIQDANRAEGKYVDEKQQALTQKLKQNYEQQVALPDYAKLELEAQPILYQYGMSELESRLQKLNETHRGRVTPQFTVEATQRILAQAHGEQNRQFQATYDNVKQVQNYSSELVEKRFRLQAMADSAKIASGLVPVDEGIQNLEQTSLNYIKENNLSLQDSLRVRLAATETMLSSGQMGLDAKVKVLAYNQRLSSALTQINTLREEESYRTMPEAERRARLMAIASENQLQFGDVTALADPLADVRRNVETEQLGVQLGELEKRNIVTQANRVQFNEHNVGDAVGTLIQQGEGSANAILNDPNTKGVRFWEHVGSVYKQYQDYAKLKTNTVTTISDLQIRKYRIQQEYEKLKAGGGGDTEILDALRAIALSNIDKLPPEMQPTVTSTATKALDITSVGNILQNIDKEFNTQIAQLQSNLANTKAGVARFGLDDVFNTEGKGSSLETMRSRFKGEISGYTTLINNLPATKQVTGQGVTPNFNRGGTGLAANPTRIGLTKSLDGITHEPIIASNQLQSVTYGKSNFAVPFRPGTQVTVSDEWGGAGSAVYARRGRPHAGVDFAVASGTPVISPVAGVVVRSETQINGQTGKGYGNYIDVKIPDGRVLRYAHLSGAFVTPGQEVQPGQVLARSGDTGAPGQQHLHFEVRDGTTQYYFEGTTNPVSFLQEVKSGFVSRSPRRNNELNNFYSPYSNNPPVALPRVSSRALKLPLGRFLAGGMVYSPTTELAAIPISAHTEYNRANPIRGMPVQSRIEGVNLARVNKPGSNYGYTRLAKDKALANKLAETASWLGVPAVWLADVVYFESGFDEQLVNQYGCTGLFQYCGEQRDEFGGLSSIKNMSSVDQFELFKKYANKWGARGNIKSIEELYTLFQRPALLPKLKKGDTSVLDMRDGNGGSIGEYIEKHIGREVGRKYRVNSRSRRVSSANIIHDKYHSDCAVCNQLAASGSPIIPHEAEVG